MARILIAEHDPVAAEAAAIICKAARHAVTVVGSGVEALLLLDALPFDLVIAGGRLPRLDGEALTRALRAGTGPNVNAPVVGVVGAIDVSAAEAMFEAGADTVVTRPFRHDELARAVARLLARDTPRVTIFRATPSAHEGPAFRDA